MSTNTSDIKAKASREYMARQLAEGKRRLTIWTTFPKKAQNLCVVQLEGAWPADVLSNVKSLKFMRTEDGRIFMEELPASGDENDTSRRVKVETIVPSAPKESQPDIHMAKEKNQKQNDDESTVATEPPTSDSQAEKVNDDLPQIHEAEAKTTPKNTSVTAQSSADNSVKAGALSQENENMPHDVQDSQISLSIESGAASGNTGVFPHDADVSNAINDVHIDSNADNEPLGDDEDAPIPSEIQAEMGEIYNLFLQNEPEFPADESNQSHPDSDTEPPADDWEDDSWVSDISGVTRADIQWAVKNRVAPKFFRPSDNMRVEREIAEREEDESFLCVCKYTGLDTPLKRAAYARSKASAMPAGPHAKCQEKCTTEDIDLDAELQPAPKGLTPERIAELEAEFEKQEREYEIEQEKRKEQEPPEKTWLDEMEEFRQRCLRDKERRRRKYFPDEDDDAEGNGEREKDDDDDD